MRDELETVYTSEDKTEKLLYFKPTLLRRLNDEFEDSSIIRTIRYVYEFLRKGHYMRLAPNGQGQFNLYRYKRKRENGGCT